MNNFGLRLQSIRKQRGMTQKALAERINKSLSAVSSYETNVQMPPFDVLMSIASVLNVSLDYLAGLEHRETILLDSFPDDKKELLIIIAEEILSPSGNGKELSPAQKDILNRLLCVFFNKP